MTRFLLSLLLPLCLLLTSCDDEIYQYSIQIETRPNVAYEGDEISIICSGVIDLDVDDHNNTVQPIIHFLIDDKEVGSTDDERHTIRYTVKGLKPGDHVVTAKLEAKRKHVVYDGICQRALLRVLKKE